MPTATSEPTSRSGLLKAYLVLSIVLAVLVLVQAWMAGNSDILFGDIDIFLHGMVGNLSYLLAAGILVVTIVVRAPKSALIHAVALVAFMTVQIGLGYMGRDMPQAAAWHVPIGVLIFGIAIAQISQARALVKGDAAV